MNNIEANSYISLNFHLLDNLIESDNNVNPNNNNK